MIKRTIYGILAGLAVIGTLIYLPKYVVNIIVTLLAIGAINEFINAINNMGYKPIKTVLYFSCAILPFIGIVDTFKIYKWTGIFAGILVMWALIYACFIRGRKTTLIDICFTFFGAIYITFLLSFILQTFYIEVPGSTQNIGKFLIWFILLGACLTDAFAYFVGSKFGKHKLCPNISPNKSVEGAIGGLIGGSLSFVIYSVILNNYFGFGIQYVNMGIMGILVSIFAQMGDLVASVIKRNAGIKDFGNFLPGHGGVIDRIDSILFAAPITYYIVTLLLERII